MEVVSDRRYRFDVPPDELWRSATALDAYREWWPWLRHIDAAGFEAGDVWTCAVQPPLPYAVRFTVELLEVRPRSRVRAAVAGDVVGTARLDIAPLAGGCEARLVSRLAPGSGLLRLASQVARPLVRFGHDWVLDSGARQFEQGALSRARQASGNRPGRRQESGT